MAATTSVESKRKPLPKQDRIPGDGLTGMSLQTQRHFFKVKDKMNAFVDEQNTAQIDAERLEVQGHQQHLTNSPAVDRSKHLKLLEQIKSPRTHSDTSTPSSTRKHISHHGKSLSDHGKGLSQHGKGSAEHETNSSRHGSSSSHHGSGSSHRGTHRIEKHSSISSAK